MSHLAHARPHHRFWFLLADIAHGNFTPESAPTTEAPRPRERGPVREQTPRHHVEVPVSTAKQDDPTYMAVIIGVLMAVILLLAVAMFFIIAHHRQRKNFASPLGTKSSLPNGALGTDSSYGTSEKDPTLMGYRVEDLDERYAGAKLTTLPRELNDRLLGDVRLDDYQEPFHDSASGKYREPHHAAYYGYSTVVIDNKDLHDSVEHSGWYIYTFKYAAKLLFGNRRRERNSLFAFIYEFEPMQPE